MGRARYEYCDECTLRDLTEKRLSGLSPYRGNKEEAPADYWSRVEKAGRLGEALKIHDQLAIEYAEWRHTRRETIRDFDQRMEQEGRQAEAERLRAQLAASGLTQREVQTGLVERLQPLNGSVTRSWETPDPWLSGRLFRKRSEHQRVLEVLDSWADDEGAEDEELSDARNRLAWARHRLEERQALAAVRKRAYSLKVAALASAPARP
jgi:hypothetical protein